MTDITALRELERKATPGPWTHDRETDYVWGPQQQMVFDGINGLRVRGFGEGLPMDENADLVCTLRNALPALLDELKRLAVDVVYQQGIALDAMARAEAAEAKLAQVREWLHTPEEDDNFDNGWYDAKEELRAILDAEPPTATVQPQGEEGA